MLIKKVYTVYKLLLFSLHIVYKIYPYIREQGTLTQPIHVYN